MKELMRGKDIEETLYDELLIQFGKGLFRKKLKIKTLLKVEALSLMHMGLTNLSFLKYFPNCKILNVTDNQLVSLDELRFVPHLHTLVIRNNPIRDMEGLKHVLKLISLDVSNIAISFQHLMPLAHLEELKVNHCALHQIPECQMHQLRVLSASHNYLTNLNFLSCFPYLEELYLHDNLIFDADDLAPCKNLSVIHLEHNQLFRLPDLSGIKELLYLNVFDNPFFIEADDIREMLFYIDTLIVDEQDIDYFEIDDVEYQNKQKITYVVSACLLGENCKYNGGNNRNEALLSFLKNKNYIGVCPEQLGGLPTPRPCSEIACGKVINEEGEDVSAEYLLGAKEALRIAKENNATVAILQARSPSCGKGHIYDGTFTHTLISGDGLTTRIFEKNGIYVWNSDRFVEYMKANVKK